MLTVERLNLAVFPWEETLATLADRTIYQSLPWLNFLKATQKGEPVLAALRSGTTTVGYFTGMIVQKFGLRILGSPFPGWSTSYMGLNLRPEVPWSAAVDALQRFAFADLHCSHLEFLDRKLSPNEINERGLAWTPLNGFEVDLSVEEENVFQRMQPSCRQAIRRAIRLGVTVEESRDPDFADEYYAQLKDVFRRQGLVPTYGIERVRELMRHIQPTGKLLLLRARDSAGRSIATGIFLSISPSTMYFWGGASWFSYQSLRPNDLLMWSAMRIGRDRGMRILDLGGAGDYKKKFSGNPISVPWVRVSSRPLVPFLRDVAKRWWTFKRRIQGSRWQGQGRRLVTSDHSDSSVNA
jgi:CelD/BcsL family acetyltransferase involved in cellulose biosynthesis